MNKKLIALALAALPAAAMADVTIYGRFVGGLEHDSAKAQDGTSLSENGVNDYLSWIGFKGQEDVGNGLKAIWQVETALSIDGTTAGTHNSDASNNWATRSTFIGVKSDDFGTVRLGKYENAQRNMFDVDVWNNASGANALDIFKRVGTRPNNSISYQSPNFAGFDFSAMWAAGENKDTTSGASDLVNFGLNYRNSGFFAQYGFDSRKRATASFAATKNEKQTAHTVEAGYAANGLLVSVGLQRATNWGWEDRGYLGESTGNNGITNLDNHGNLKSKEAALTVAYDIGAFTPKFSYAKGWDLKSEGDKVTDSGYKQFILGVDYHLSKRTKASLAYGRLTTGAGAEYIAEGGAGQLLDDNLKRQSTTSVSLEHWF